MTKVKPRRLAEFPDVLHMKDVAELLGVSLTSTYEYARRGELPCPIIKCGRRYFVSKAAFEEALRPRAGQGEYER